MAATTSTTFSFSLTIIALCFLLRNANGDPNITFEPNSTMRTPIQPSPPPRFRFHTLQLSSLIPSDASCCSSPSLSAMEGLNKGASLRVVHKYGPCGQAQQQPRPTAAEILLHDESRVQTIQSRFRKAAAGGDVKVTESSTTIPAKDARTIGAAGNFMVTVGIGTPPQTLSLVFDTGSDLTWTQCQPCARFCYEQREKIFDPSSSTSYRNVSCSARSCSALASVSGMKSKCSSSTCKYEIQYSDSSFSNGFFGTEKLTLSSTDVFKNFFFGCGQNNQGTFAGSAGLLGLGRDKLSFVSQTAQKYKKLFSYCLPSTFTTTGFLNFGHVSTTSVKYTPLTTVPGGANFYTVDITSITVGGEKLPIPATVFSTAGAVIDSGAVFTRLPPVAYSALRSAFRKLMSGFPAARPTSIFDTCFDFTTFNPVLVPTIAFSFVGGVEVEIHGAGVLYFFSLAQACLGFVANGGASDVAVLGNLQQVTWEVVYDGAGGRVGFAAGGCS
ncbi:unnamed protein product [Linum tenue]|uniref:Peptidase A1 domain-containing protein n=1 Tax=Linum tenue TaxID=586396 RepID=A0AAV0GU80_9ROSI|nr:unnamed protein product [Linum tenue]